MNREKYKAELLLLWMLPEIVLEKPIHGRLTGLLQKLRDYSGFELRKLKETKFESSAVLVNKFLEDAKWFKKKKHIASYLSFLAIMLEKTDSPFNLKLQEIVVDLFDYFDRAKQVPNPCVWSGEIALQKWGKLFKKEETNEITTY